jgi:hypothetical protein
MQRKLVFLSPVASSKNCSELAPRQRLEIVDASVSTCQKGSTQLQLLDRTKERTVYKTILVITLFREKNI